MDPRRAHLEGIRLALQAGDMEAVAGGLYELALIDPDTADVLVTVLKIDLNGIRERVRASR